MAEAKYAYNLANALSAVQLAKALDTFIIGQRACSAVLRPKHCMHSASAETLDASHNPLTTGPHAVSVYTGRSAR
jgi:hypothetical protein